MLPVGRSTLNYNNYVVVAKSGDKGESWQEILVIDPGGQQSEFSKI
jgi:hypothetical protein